jgi:hypothetical protein
MKRVNWLLSLAGCGLAVGIGLLPGDAYAQRRDEAFGRVGNVQVFRVLESGRFDRCYAMVPDFQLGARLFWKTGTDYILTVPGVETPGPKRVEIRTPRGVMQVTGRAEGGWQGRTIMTLPGPQADQFISLRGAFEVNVAGVRFPYELRGATMEQVFRAVEDCVFRNSR